MKNRLLAAVAAGALAFGMADSASALTYVTQFDWTDAGGNVTSKGTVTAAEQADGKTVRVTVDLTDDLDLIIDTGSHWAFTWSMSDTASAVTLVTTGGTNPFVYQGAGSFTQTGAFGSFTNAFACCGPGANNGKTSLVFDVFNAGGLTFAGVGATFDSNTGQLLTQGTGNRFVSNTSGSEGGFDGGWWFAADIFDAPGGTGPGGTYVVAGRDAFCTDLACTTTTVPEPAAWGLMILGFMGTGAVLRRRRLAFA